MTKNHGLGADHSVFLEYVSQSVMTSVFLAFTLQRLISSKNTKLMIFWACVSAMALFTILFLLSGRSGLIACTVVICVSAFLYIPKHRQWQSLFLILSALTLFVLISPLMLSRVQQAYNDIVNYQSFDASSLGLRMDMWMLALKSFVQHPLFGTGVGTYPQIAASHFNTLTAAQLVFAVIHPHNQYLFFAMEYGLVGLLAFLWFMWQLLNTAYISEMPERNILFAVIAVIAVDSLYNVPLWYRAESYFFYAVLALLVASNQKSKDKQTI
jgi:O-antigen ligase